MLNYILALALAVTYFLLKYIIIVLVVVFFWFYFNRDPKRILPEGDVIVAPADGRIISISSDKKYNIITIFMNISNVHVQRVPYNGRIINIKKKSGSFSPAFLTSASKNNQVVTKIKSDVGIIIVKQISGIFVRRIKNYLEQGDLVKTGDKLGKIMLGSRVELWLPKKVEIEVEEGQKVYASLTIISRL